MADEKTARYLSLIGRCNDEGRATFESLIESITAAVEEEVEEVEKDTCSQVNRAKHDADEAARKIMKQRDDRIRQIRAKADTKNKLIRKRNDDLLSEIQFLREGFDNKMRERKQRIEIQLKPPLRVQSDLTAVEETNTPISVQAVAQDSLHSVRQLTAACRRIKFARQRNDSEELVGSLVGVKHSWEMAVNIAIPSTIAYPELLARMGDGNSVILTNEVRSGLFEMNIDTQKARTIIADTHFDICDCACGENAFVLSDYNSKSVHIYDYAGSQLRSISIPSACARVAFARDGLVIAGDEQNGKLYFVNTRNGKIIRSLPIDGKKINGIYPLSRGWVAIQTGITTVSLFDELGVLKDTIQDGDWSELRCAVSRDVIYIMYKKMDDPTTYVGMRTPNGRLENIIRCKISKFLLSEFVVMTSGSIAINGDNELLVFKQAPGFAEILKVLK